MSIRARFIGADGASFFDRIDQHRPIYERFEPVNDDLDAVDILQVRRLVYQREVWFIPVGPLASPIGEPGEQLDAVYRFKEIR